jgi:hypothetical protein
MMTSRSLICLLENQNGGKLQKVILSFEIYHPKNNVHNQDGNHDDNKVRITIFFFFLIDRQ